MVSKAKYLDVVFVNLFVILRVLPEPLRRLSPGNAQSVTRTENHSDNI